MQFVEVGGLKVAASLHEFVTAEALPGTGIDRWPSGRASPRCSPRLAPRNRALLDQRDALQQQIDAWHRAHRGQPIDTGAYMQLPARHRLPGARAAGFRRHHANVDPEIATIAGPQLVVPVTNARYALNAANARWGSLYDALYGTDAIPEDGGATRAGGYNPVRGARVVAKARAFLDQAAPLAAGSHADATGYALRRRLRWR